VDALHAVIQQAWTGEALPRSWTEGVLCPVYKKGDKLDCKNYRGICLLNVTYKVFAKILYDRLLSHPRTIRDVGQSVAIGDKHFEVVKDCMYLGSLLTPTNDVSLEIQRRIQTAHRCFCGLRKHLQSSHLSRQTFYNGNCHFHKD
jgi:hypothetical protein